ncbi:type 2 lanthipeptide synthetase LanM [Streptomyces microflavus]|uniref:type 2 lanthipeptide synthetase LanM n=1 Tax=Streptomyces microflavus TaxID=1919 RepID=UPI003680D475
MEKELIGSGGTGAAARIALPGTDGVTGPAGGTGTNMSAGGTGTSIPAGGTGINTPATVTGAHASAASAGFTGTFRAAPGSARTAGVAPASGLTATGPTATAGSPGAPRTNGAGRTNGVGGPHTAADATSSAAGTGPWWLPGVVGELPMGEPDWVSFVRDVIADAPPEAVVAERDHPGLTGFALVVAPFAERAAGRLLTSPSNNAVRAGTAVGLAPVLEDFRSHLTRRLARLAARTLVLELHKARRAGRLAGDGPEARFRDFLRLTAGRDGLAAFLTAYPVLARILARTSLAAADALTEMLGRLADDRELLDASGVLGDGATGTPAAGRGPRALTGVEAGAGDSHRGGRSVMILRFTDGSRLVYKPRPLAAHRHFNTLVEWFGSLPGAPSLRALRVVDRGDYGWVEFVEERPCSSTAETHLFYRRQGALLALLHLLDGTDLHQENLIACGPHPVLVDVETLFHPPLSQAHSADPAARALHDSVHRVGLLPQLLVGDSAALDVSAIGGGRAAASPIETADWADAGRDTMRLVRRSARFTESANRPRLQGVPADPSAYTDSLCEGFRAGYTSISDYRDELLGRRGLLTDFAQDEVRVVPRPTWTYTTLLDESTHPDLMRDAAERHQVLSLLRTPTLGVPALPGLEDEEIEELWAGDVPVFLTRPGSTDLWSGTGRAVPVAPGPTGLARVEEKVRAMDTVDRQDQERIIRAAMVSTSSKPPHRAEGGARARTAATAPEPEQLLSAARSVGDQLVSLAYRHKERTNWIGLELLGERYWRLAPMAADLASGYTGPALFLAQLAALTGAERYAETAREALAPVPGLLDALHGRVDDLTVLGSGAFAGLGGIAYALAEVGSLLGDRAVLDLAGPATRLACAASAAEDGYGVRGGAAGGLVSLLAVHRTTGRAEAWRGAERCAERISVAPLPEAGGFAEGAAGIGWALLRFAAAGGGEQYRTAGLGALRRAAVEVTGGRAWCEGAAGVALAIADSPDALADPDLSGWLAEQAGELADSAPLADDSLCHGELGLLELLGHGALTGDRTPWVRRAGTLLAAADREGPRCGTPGHVPHPGLLTGLSGVGHGLLRAGFPDRIGSALLLNPSAGAA